MLHHAMPTCPSLSLQWDGVPGARKDASHGRTLPHEPFRLFPADRHDRRPDDPSRCAHVAGRPQGFSIGVARDVVGDRDRVDSRIRRRRPGPDLGPPSRRRRHDRRHRLPLADHRDCRVGARLPRKQTLWPPSRGSSSAWKASSEISAHAAAPNAPRSVKALPVGRRREPYEDTSLRARPLEDPMAWGGAASREVREPRSSAL
jgi:hypothetical protein